MIEDRKISIRELEDGIKSSFWQYIKKELLEMRLNVLEGIVREESMVSIYKAQGRAEVLNDIAFWPEVQLVEELRDKNKIEKEKQDDSGE